MREEIQYCIEMFDGMRSHDLQRRYVRRVNLLRIDRWPVQMFYVWPPAFHNPSLSHSARHFVRLIFFKVTLDKKTIAFL